MNREAFKQRMHELKSYREQNPGKGYLDWKASRYAEGGEIPPERMEYKGKLYTDKLGRKYTEQQYQDYLKNSTDEISKFDGTPMVRGMKPIVDIEDAANFTPIGDAIAVGDTYNAIRNNDWIGAGLAAASFLPFMPRVARKTSAPVRRHIPTVDKGVVQRKIDEALGLHVPPTPVIEKTFDDRNRLFEELRQPYAKQRARNVDTMYGTDYEKTYNELIKQYEDPNQFFAMPYPEYGPVDRPTTKAQVTPARDSKITYNRDRVKTADDVYDGLVRHEQGHIIDYKANSGMDSEFLKKLGEKSKFVPFHQAKMMYPNLTRPQYNNLLQGTEIKSYMNQFRDYLNKQGKLIDGEYLDGYKNFRRDLLNAGDDYNGTKMLFNLYRSPKLFQKDFKLIPVANNDINTKEIA